MTSPSTHHNAPSLPVAPLLLALALALALGAGRAEGGAPGALSTARALRSVGCAGHAGTRLPLRGNSLLDDAATRWARGLALSTAVEVSGYRADQTAALHVSGAASLGSTLARNLCEPLLDPSNQDLGSVQAGRETWLIIAAPFAPPSARDGDGIAYQVLRLVNGVRASAHVCGRTPFQAAPALRLATTLNEAALAHALDMLRYGYFDHNGHDGSSPGTRVAASGYRYQTVGENIAEGPQTPQEVVQGWIDSPGHCQNIMNPRFTDMGLGFAANSSGRPRIEWVQDFAMPR
jgi:uncharacterized protein YkwD